MKKELKKVRAFIGFQLPGPVMETLETIQDHFRGFGFPIKWIRPGNMHLTIKFLGDVPLEDMDKISGAVCEAAQDYLPVSLYAEGVGVFPDLRRPGVLWVGLEGGKNVLARFHNGVEKRLSILGFPEDSRPFRGHITLARIKKRINGKKLGRIINDLAGYKSPCFSLDTPKLFRSRLTPSGPVYTTHFCCKAVNDGHLMEVLKKT